MPKYPSLIVYETNPIDFWSGWIDLKKFRADVFADEGFSDADDFTSPNERYQEEVKSVLEEAQALATTVLGYEGDVRQGPFLSALPDPDGSCSMPLVAWKQDNNGTTYIASLVPLQHLDSGGYSSAAFRDGLPYQRS